jgi:iron(III) transport system ATP-binding protein
MLKLQNVSKAFATKAGAAEPCVDNLSFSVKEGEFFTFLGPSGSGKTTILRMIAGLENPDGGEIWIGGEPVFISSAKINHDPRKRQVGMVFQSYAIWPHMSVFRNAAFPLEVAGRDRLSKQVIKDRVSEALELVALGPQADQSAATLSGGQKQRLALCRAIVARPKLLLLDEPLSSIDTNLRLRMRRDLKEIQRKLGITFIYVTHDQPEAMILSDRVAVFASGKIQQIGTPDEIYWHPSNALVAGFLGQVNVLSGIVRTKLGSKDITIADTIAGPIRLNTNATITEAKTVQVLIRPEQIEIEKTPRNTQSVPFTVSEVVFVGPAKEARVVHGETTLKVLAKYDADISIGDVIFVSVDTSCKTTITS